MSTVASWLAAKISACDMSVLGGGGGGRGVSPPLPPIRGRTTSRTTAMIANKPTPALADKAAEAHDMKRAAHDIQSAADAYAAATNGNASSSETYFASVLDFSGDDVTVQGKIQPDNPKYGHVQQRVKILIGHEKLPLNTLLKEIKKIQNILVGTANITIEPPYELCREYEMLYKSIQQHIDRFKDHGIELSNPNEYKMLIDIFIATATARREYPHRLSAV